MSDDPIPVKCTKCGYETTYGRNDRAPLDLALYNRCPEITERLNHGLDAEKIGGNPMHCSEFRAAAKAAVEAAVAKDREPPTGP